MRDRILRELQAEYEQRRADSLLQAEQRRQEAEQRCNGLTAALAARQELIFGSIRSILDNGAGSADLPEKMALSNRGIAQILKANGYAEDYLEPVCRCKLCNDAGYVGEPVREMCACLKHEFFKRLYREIGLDAGNDRFENFDLELFDDVKPLPQYQGNTQRQSMILLRRTCEQYANTYPEAESKDLLMIGKSGLGKTFLMNCIAGRLLERGFNVLTVSSYRFQEAARRAMFEGNADELNSMMETDVLLLDDLGSEALIRNVTIEQLFNLINERQRSGKGTIISTNLNEAELRERYTERIASRLTATRQCRSLLFFGEDVRRKL